MLLSLLSCVAPASASRGFHGRHHQAARRAVHAARGHAADEPALDPAEECAKVCSADSGIDADPEYCNNECAVYTDLTNHVKDDGVGTKEAIKQFVGDESYNEKGGTKMEDQFEEEHGEEVLDCAPSVDVDKEPSMEDMDVNGDGVVSKEEAENYGHKACVPDEMTDQIFEEADVDQDDKVTKEEFAEAGEDTAAEEELDEALEGSDDGAPKGESPFEGDDEHAVVDNQDFEEVDKNGDEVIDAGEFHDHAEFEAEKRTETNAAHVPVSGDETDMVADGAPAVGEAMDKVDENGDDVLTKEEFESTEGGGSDLGEEIQEAAKQDEDMPDPDGLDRANGAELLSKKFRTAQRAEAAFLSKFAVVKPRHTFVMMQRSRSHHRHGKQAKKAQRSKHGRKAQKGLAAAFHAAVKQHHAKRHQPKSHAPLLRRNHRHLRHLRRA